MIFFYIRHGDPTYKPDALTPLGKRQAEALAKRFAIYGLDEIYSSPAIRAVETAQPTCEVLKKEPVILDWCSEAVAYREFSIKLETGRTQWVYLHPETCERFASAEVRALGSEWYTHPAFEGTSLAEGIHRIERETDAFLLSLGYRHDRSRGGFVAEEPNEKRIALFAHEGFGNAFLSTVMDIPYNDFCVRFGIGFTGVTAIHFNAVNGFCIPRILQHSSDAHLFREGLGLKYQNNIPL